MARKRKTPPAGIGTLDSFGVEIKSIEETPGSASGKGPKNKMNDLSYGKWMLYQKSFSFSEFDISTIACEAISFFTKEKYESGRPSLSAVMTPCKDVINGIGDRIIKQCDVDLTFNEFQQNELDFCFIDLREELASAEQWDAFIESSDEFWTHVRKVTRDDSYVMVAMTFPKEPGNNFPIPWAFSLSSRDHMQLRDEKIVYNTAIHQMIHLAVFKSTDDEFEGIRLSSENIILSDVDWAGDSYPTCFIVKPNPRTNTEIKHPAKYPEELVEKFVPMFSEKGEWVFDPMVGTGSTIVAARWHERNGVGIDLQKEFVDISEERLREKFPTSTLQGIGISKTPTIHHIIHDNALNLQNILNNLGIEISYTCTSPPYWSMLQNPGSENQRKRMKNARTLNTDIPQIELAPLKTVYSEDAEDLGNISDYDKFLELLCEIYNRVAKCTKEGGVLTFVVKNVKKNHTVYPLAWDLVQNLCNKKGSWSYLGTQYWCQDDIGLKPFAIGHHWVSNTLHQYCVHLVKRN